MVWVAWLSCNSFSFLIILSIIGFEIMFWISTMLSSNG